MASVGGRLAKVMYGSVVIAGIGEWSMSGFVPGVVDDTAFGDSVMKYLNAGIADAGEVSFSGNYDPLDTTGQVALNGLATSDVGLTNLYFYENATVHWRVAAGGSIILTEVQPIKFIKNGLATCAFKGKISAKAMERVTA
jgi:hypothetical protein